MLLDHFGTQYSFAKDHPYLKRLTRTEPTKIIKAALIVSTMNSLQQPSTPYIYTLQRKAAFPYDRNSKQTRNVRETMWGARNIYT